MLDRLGLWLCIAAVTLPIAVRAAATEAGITVIGTGEATTKPTAVTIVGLITAEAPLAADAVVKFRDSKRRTLEALEDAQVPGLDVEGEGFAIRSTINQQQMQLIWQGQAPQQLDAQVRVTERITIRLTGIDAPAEDALIERIMAVLDTAKEVGLTTGAALAQQNGQQIMWGQQIDTSLASFTHDDPDALKAKAYEAAIADARAQAQRLAEVAGVKLGPIVAIVEAADSQGANPITAMYYYGSAPTGSEDDEQTATSFGQLKARINLQVRFAIAQE